MLRAVADGRARAELRTDLDGLAREGARRMLTAALEAEVDAYLAEYAAERDEDDRRLVVRNGHARDREILTAAGAVAVRTPRVDDRRVDPVTGELRDELDRNAGNVIVEGSGQAVAPRRLGHMVPLRLEPELAAALRELADRQGETVSDLLREGVAALLEDDQASTNPSTAASFSEPTHSSREPEADSLSLTLRANVAKL